MAAGTIKVLSVANRSYYTAQEVQELLGVGKTKAYEMIRHMRMECIEAGSISKDYPEGKIPKKYFNKQCMIE